jgi:hypothetical protein
MRSMLSRRVEVLLPLVVFLLLFQSTAVLSQQRSQETENRKYEEATKWVVELLDSPPVEVGRYDTYDDAENAAINWSRKNPRDLRLWRIREVTIRSYPHSNNKAQPTDQVTETSVSEKRTANALSKLPVDPSNPNSLSGKRIVGTFGATRIALSFAENGKVTFTQPDNENRELSKGEWSQTGKAISIRTSNFRYMGLVDGNRVSGRRIPTNGDSPQVEEWTASIETQSKTASSQGNTSKPPIKREFSLYAYDPQIGTDVAQLIQVYDSLDAARAAISTIADDGQGLVFGWIEDEAGRRYGAR